MRLLWLKIYTPSAEQLPARAPNHTSEREDRERSGIRSVDSGAFEPMYDAEVCLDDRVDAHHVALWATVSAERLLRASPESSAAHSNPGELRSNPSGIKSSREAS